MQIDFGNARDSAPAMVAACVITGLANDGCQHGLPPGTSVKSGTASCGARLSASVLQILAMAGFRAISALNRTIFHHDLLAPDLIIGSSSIRHPCIVTLVSAAAAIAGEPCP